MHGLTSTLQSKPRSSRQILWKEFPWGPTPTGSAWTRTGQTTRTTIPTFPREQCTLIFSEKGGMSYHIQEGKHQAVQSLDQYVKFMENILWTTQTCRQNSSILMGKWFCNNRTKQMRLRLGIHSNCNLFRVISEIKCYRQIPLQRQSAAVRDS